MDWSHYVGWANLKDAPNRLYSTPRAPQLRPGSLSNQMLLDNSPSSPDGLLGSHHLLRKNLKRDVDYVLLPSSVWDVLYELYGGGPPLPRMVLPTSEDELSLSVVSMYNTNDVDIDSVEVSLSSTSKKNQNNTKSNNKLTHKVVSPLILQEEDHNQQQDPDKILPVSRNLQVFLHPWILQCQLGDPHQPYRRGDAGILTIHTQVSPGQPLWRFLGEILTRLPINHPRAANSHSRGHGRLWKRVDVVAPTNGGGGSSGRYGPWQLLCKNRFMSFPLGVGGGHWSEYQDEWMGYCDHATVESAGLCDGMRVMFEYALVAKNGSFAWPREAAAKAGRMRRLAEEDQSFRHWLQGMPKKHPSNHPPLIGAMVDTMDSTGRWYQAEITQIDNKAPRHLDYDDSEEEEEDSVEDKSEGLNRRICIDFSHMIGLEEWIDVSSDRLAVAGRYTLDSMRALDASNSLLPTASPGDSGSRRKSQTGKETSTTPMDSGGNNTVCTFPGYGACGLTNLGNTCYMNAALQCISYMPLLRSYLLSGAYKMDSNKDNPLGTGGKLLEEFADLMRVLWSGKYGARAPSRFRAQLGKVRSQFSANDQQDAQELLNAILDALHEDSSKIRKKPLVQALEDDWVNGKALGKVGLESWRRYLRRNRSIIANIAMGQVLNRVTCPVCNHSSLNFDPFNMLSLPFPTIAEVKFKCTVLRRASGQNCTLILDRRRKSQAHPKPNSIGPDDEMKKDHHDLPAHNKTPTLLSSAPSEKLIAEEYIVAVSRLSDISDLKVRLQALTGIHSSRLKLCKTEDVPVELEVPPSPQSPLCTYVKTTVLAEKQGPALQLAKSPPPNGEEEAPMTTIIAYESTLLPRRAEEDTESTEDDEEEGDVVRNSDEDNSEKSQKTLERLLQLYGDSGECCSFDTDPTPFSRAMSRRLWPKSVSDFKLGLRVDAIDHREHWFPGSVVEIMEGCTNSEDGSANDNSGSKSPSKDQEDPENITKVRIHFDNFSSKWDELYTIDHFRDGKVRPLYSHAAPRTKPLEFLVHHRHSAGGKPDSQTVSLFGQSFFVQCYNEWSTARAGAHILAQACRFLSDKIPKDQYLLKKTMAEARTVISDIIRILIEIDRRYVKSALTSLASLDEPGGGDHQINSTTSNKRHSRSRRKNRESAVFNATLMTLSLSKKLSNLLPKLPFDVRVCAADAPLGGSGQNAIEEVAFPFSLVRTVGNYMNARHAIVFHWREYPMNKFMRDMTVLYTHPTVGIHRETSTDQEQNNDRAEDDDEEGNRPENGNSSKKIGGMHLGVCLTEFCKEQQLPEGWRCTKCKVAREGRQSMALWRLPDLLTFHIKRFNCSARWREKISTRVNFPLTGLDMRPWCDNESPALNDDSFTDKDSTVYDLIGVINHLGGMTGGHYVASCKATLCTVDGGEEVAHAFSGEGVAGYEAEEETTERRWGLGRSKEKDAASLQSRSAAQAARLVTESSEPLWLQFDDDLVEPIPPQSVVSEGAYVLFYRKRRLNPSNIAKYSTLD